MYRNVLTAGERVKEGGLLKLSHCPAIVYTVW